MRAETLNGKSQTAQQGKTIRFSDLADVNPPVDCSQLKLDDHVSFIPMADVTDRGQWIGRQTRAYAEVQNGYSAFQEGDVLFAKITPCTENGKGCHALGLTNGLGFGSTEFHVLRARSGVNTRLVYHFSVAQDLRARAASLMGGSAGQQRVPSDFFKLFQISASCLDDQDRKAELFDAIDDAIEATQAVIQQTRQLKTALLQDLLTNGLPGRHKRFKEVKSLGCIPADWDIARLDEIATVERGKFTHRPRNDPRFYGGEIPFVQTGDVVASGDYLREHSQTLNKRGLSVSRLFPKGTILFAIAASVGATTIASYNVAFPDSIVGITPKSGIPSLFLLRVLQSARDRIISTATESAQANISLKLLCPIRFAIPPTQEQEAIAEIVRSVEERTERTQTQLNQLSHLKRALSQGLLTGRIPVFVAEREVK